MKLKLTLDLEPEQRFAYIAALFTPEGADVDLNHLASLMFGAVLKAATKNPEAFGAFLNGAPTVSPEVERATLAMFNPTASPAEQSAELPQEPCAACGTMCDGEFSIEDHAGDERALCTNCGRGAFPSVPELCVLISARDRQLATTGGVA